MAKEREEKAKIDCDADRNNSDYRYQELQHRTGMQGATREFVILLRIRLALVAFDGEGRRQGHRRDQDNCRRRCSVRLKRPLKASGSRNSIRWVCERK